MKWYREKSRQYAQDNNDQRIPALAFLYIPLIEYSEAHTKEKAVNGDSDGVGSSRLNSGLLTSFVEMGDVMCKYMNIALAYGGRCIWKS